MEGWNPDGVAARLRRVIDQQDGGHVDVAARRLGVPEAELERILRAEQSADVRTLAAAVHGYRVDACWLLVGTERIRPGQLTDQARVHVAEMLSAIANELMRSRKQERASRTSGNTMNPAAEPRLRRAG